MRHGRDDYNRRIQDTAKRIPVNEPVFLLRAQDQVAPQAIRIWASLARGAGASAEIVDGAIKQAAAMEEWQQQQGSHTPDL